MNVAPGGYFFPIRPAFPAEFETPGISGMFADCATDIRSNSHNVAVINICSNKLENIATINVV